MLKKCRVGVLANRLAFYVSNIWRASTPTLQSLSSLIRTRRFGKCCQVGRPVTSRRRDVRNRYARFGQISIDNAIALASIAPGVCGIIQLDHAKGSHGSTITNDEVDVLLIYGVAKSQGIARKSYQVAQSNLARNVACRVRALEQDLEERLLDFA